MSRYQLCTLVFRLAITSAAWALNETGGQSWRAAQTLLGPRIDGVDPPCIDLDGDAGQRGDGIDGDHRTRFVGDPGNLLDRLPGACGGLGMDDPDELGTDLRDGRLDLLGVETPRRTAARLP